MIDLMLRLARWRVSRFCIGWLLTTMSFLLPADRLLDTDSLTAFTHPRPAYPFHVLLIPKRPVASLLELPPDDPFVPDLLAAVQELIRRFDLEKGGYRLVANGGKFQDVPHLHFHLIAE